MSNNFFTICSFFYSLMLTIIYFKRKNIGTLETKTYTAIILTNLLNEICAILCAILILHKDSFPVLNDIVGKTLLVCFITWEIFFTLYIVIVTRKNIDNFDIASGSRKYFLGVFYVILMSFIYYLPLYYHSENNIVYSYGPSANMIYVLTAILIVIWVIIILKNYSILKSKKSIPIVLFIILTLIVVVIQKQHPGLLLITATETFITVIMYFTIENPDIKMLDEVHKAKEISDNANEEKTLFLYNMTNEIRNITKDIDISADSILDETGSKKINVDSINDNARDIKASTAKFTTMTNEILDISQVDSSSIKIYNDKYNIKLIIKELVQLYKGKCERKGLDFRTTIASDLPEYLYGDVMGVKKSLSVMLDNSVNYTEEGYVEFTVNAITKGDIARLIITVEDSGTGIKAEDLTRIFNSKENKNEKLNLNKNLYNARKLITLMGGTIIPSSIYGKGTTMKIVLDQKIAEVDETITKYEKVLDKKKILLVDDNEASVKLITKMITDTNIILEISKSGKDCLDKIRDKEKYDLILLSEKMEPLDGITVMKKLKEIRNFNTKVILLTRDNDYEYNEEYLKYGFADYILKPITKDNLLEKINKYLS